ncbi:TKL protein kinase [Phytophthora cinnamomi]|uniref:TKL protein kinase n=1 Tax=Phytophthora cinnamomi TaxID=4785 RepID=UPI0035599500|nr:TKL protein kinase [Phytophthora cinnamomi]
MVATSCWTRRLWALGVVLLCIAHDGEIVDATCAAGSTALTTEDCSGCGDYDLCLGFTDSSSCTGSGCETVGACTYECLSVDKSADKLVVLVEFGTYKSTQELAAGGYTAADLAGYPDQTSEWPTVSNNQVTALGKISVSSAVTTFIVSGGSAAVEYPKGKVSSIILSSNVISTSTSVTKVGFQNLGLENQIDTLSAFIPTSIESLDLSNTLLTAFPTELGTLQVLKELVLDNNYVTTMDSVEGINSITTLSMQNNDIDNFTAVFTKLEELYLGNNNLTSIPSAIYSYSNLKTLNLTGNPLASRDFTNKQAKFLNSLDTLGLSASDFTADVDCDETYQTKIAGVTVCITDGVPTDTTSATASGTTSSSDSKGSESKTTNTSSSSSSSTSLIVGIVCGVMVLLFAAFLLVIHRRKEQKKIEVSIASDTVGYSSDHFSSTDNWHQQLQQSRGRFTFDDVDVIIPRGSSDVSMGVPTLTRDEEEGATEVPGAATTTAVSSIPSFVSTEEAGSKGKPQRFMSIWNDLDLLSLQLRASAIKDLKPLGSGAYATVWLVRYRSLQLLASKRLKPERRTKKHTAAFVEEIKLISNFDHPNLVKLIGAAWTVETDLQMLLEYMEAGDLRRYLADPNTPSGWTTVKFNIAIDIIEALVYLHSFQPPLVHRDLKSKNVLLSVDMEAKLSDFGTSRFRSSDKTMTGGVGTGRWLAPEVIRGDSDYGPAVDIYSFGTLLTELDTNQIPYDNVRASNGKLMSDLTILHRVATGKLHPKLRSTCGKALRDLVERCLLEDPIKRPTAPAIAYELRVIQQDMADST